MNLLALDTETTGIDLRHGAAPFFVTACTEAGDVQFWEWDVDPLTRRVIVPADDLAELAAVIHGDTLEDRQRATVQPPELVLHNAKFDVMALTELYAKHNITLTWPWDRTKDTLIAGHVLHSNQKKSLDAMAVRWLRYDLKPLEDRLEVATKAARKVVQLARLRVKNAAKKKHADVDFKDIEYAKWGIADGDRPDMPSATEESWRADYWLPRAIAKKEGYPVPADGCGHDWKLDEGRACRKCKGHLWHVVLREYANPDAEVLIPLWKTLRAELQRRKLEKIYAARLAPMRVAYGMERRGVTLSRTRLEEQTAEYEHEAETLGNVLTGIAAHKGFTLDLPRGGRNASLMTFMFDVLKLERIRDPKAKTDEPSLNKTAITHYLNTLPERSGEYAFVKMLADKRSRDTAVAYMDGYRRFWFPAGTPACPESAKVYRKFAGFPDGWEWYVLYPNLNMTGTDTLRWSSSNPNEQNISKKEGFNLRKCFGPLPGREWWSLDAKNIELRLPAYEAREEAFIALFERPDDPPYYGSNHLLVAHILLPDMFEACRGKDGEVDGRIFKKKYESTWYKWIKNGNFASLYGAGPETADAAYHIRGAQAKIKSRLAKMEALNQAQIRFADKYGYVETIPDRSVDPDRGYPILCSRTEWGRVKPTTPLNYHVQGTAMWWMGRCMVRCQDQLDEWNRRAGREDYFITMQVHDELVFDFPARANPKDNPKASNLGRIGVLKKLMEQGGVDIGVPLPVSAEYHDNNWSEGLTF